MIQFSSFRSYLSKVKSIQTQENGIIRRLNLFEGFCRIFEVFEGVLNVFVGANFCIESVRLTHITNSRDCELASLPVTLESWLDS